VEDPSSSKQDTGLPPSKKETMRLAEVNESLKVEVLREENVANGSKPRAYRNISVLLLSWSHPCILPWVEEQEVCNLHDYDQDFADSGIRSTNYSQRSKMSMGFKSRRLVCMG
jgi:hypothetical protein